MLHKVNLLIYYNNYDENMQRLDEKLLIFKKALGELAKELRLEEPKVSMTKLAYGYDINKSTLSRLESGKIDSHASTLWKIAEARGISFSEFGRRLEEKLGPDFKFMDE